MRTRPPFDRVHEGIAIGWGVILLGLISVWVVLGWSEVFGGVGAILFGAMFAFVGLFVIGVVTAIARYGLVGSAARTLFLLLAPPLTVAALLYLQNAVSPYPWW